TTAAIFPDGRRMVTSSHDTTLRVWDLKGGVVLMKLEGHISNVCAVAVSGDGQLIASGDEDGMLIVWNGETGKYLTQSITGHQYWISSLDFSPDGTVLATGSWDSTIQVWNTTTWEVQGRPLTINSHNMSLVWTPNGTRLLSAGATSDPTIREWDTSTWQQVGGPWSGHTSDVNALAVNSTGTLLASASSDKHVRLWRLSDRQTIAIFTTTREVLCVAFSIDGTRILGGGEDKKISGW
ncbi:WD40 repeat-like protein, partial [Rhizopogon vinicolor AM-OR11-026]